MEFIDIYAELKQVSVPFVHCSYKGKEETVLCFIAEVEGDDLKKLKSCRCLDLYASTSGPGRAHVLFYVRSEKDRYVPAAFRQMLFAKQEDLLKLTVACKGYDMEEIVGAGALVVEVDNRSALINNDVLKDMSM